MNHTRNITKQNQRTILLLLLAFLLPVLAAWLVYANMGTTNKTNNNGELVIPPRPLDGIPLRTLAGKAYSSEQLKGHWYLIYIGHGPCDQECRGSLSKMHQTRMAQGKAMSRVRLLYIALDRDNNQNLERLAEKYSHLTVLTSEPGRAKEVSGFFQVGDKHTMQNDRLIYMVDPMGNLMMRYTQEVRLIGLIEDLEHLLKISQIG